MSVPRRPQLVVPVPGKLVVSSCLRAGLGFLKTQTPDGRNLLHHLVEHRPEHFSDVVSLRTVQSVQCESFRVFLMCLHGLDIFVNVDVIFLPSVCDTFCVSTFSLGQGSRSFCHELYEQSTVVCCKSGRDACFYNCVYSLCRPCFLGSLVSLAGIQQFCPPFWSACKHTWKYVLLSALLHDQSCLQSSSCFQHQFVWLPFSRTLVCKGGCSFHVHGSTRVVSSSLCYVAVSRARENNWDKPVLDVIIIDCLCHYH